MEVDDDFRAYKVLSHQHTPEIDRALALAGRPAQSPSPRTCCRPAGHPRHRLRPPAPGAPPPSRRGAGGLLAGKPFLRGAGPTRSASRRGRHQPLLLGADTDPEPASRSRAAIDNLVKGAAGQAVQNLNLMMGWDETPGLLNLAGRCNNRP